MLVAVPLAVACGFWSTCGAVTRTTSSRCRNLRGGPLHRCQHHGGAPAVWNDLHGLIVALASAVGFLVWHAAYPGSVLPRLVGGLLAGTS